MTAAKRLPGYRWTICVLIFFAVTINYLDRQLFSVLVPYFENDLRLGPTDLALINVSFILPYGFAMVFIGRAIDRAGIGRGLSASFLLWNVASIAHAFVRGLGGFLGVRFLLGLGESGMFPSGIKTVAEWFPARERSTATGIFNAGANLGAIAAPLLGVWLAENFGWRNCFVFTGLVGMVWLVFWRAIYRPPHEHPRVSAEERAYIASDPEEPKTTIGYGELFAMRPVYALSLAKALTDAPWWFYLFWLPKYLVDGFHVSKPVMAFALAFVYLVADAGSIAGGWLSSHLIQRGSPIGSARKTAMFVCALAVVPVVAVGFLNEDSVVVGIPGVYWAIGLVALAAGGHQGWSSNLFTLISDSVPKPAVAMAVGAINGFAMIGTSAMQFFVGRAVAVTSSYALPFAVAGTLYLVALGALQLLMPQVRRTMPERKANLTVVAASGVAILLGLGLLQYATNKPPYASLRDYLAKRGPEIQALGDPQEVGSAHVGWMEARWYRWPLRNGETKLDLVKFDDRRQPFVESKGAKAAHYVGPVEGDLAKP